MTIQEIVAAVEQLNDGNDIKAVVDAVKFAQSRRQRVAADEFKRGDIVEFADRSGRGIQGTVKYVNQKSLSLTHCHAADGAIVAGEWRVAPTFCKKVTF